MAAKSHGPFGSAVAWRQIVAGGLATAGGIGFLARKFGLTIDHVTAVELVLADGWCWRAPGWWRG